METFFLFPFRFEFARDCWHGEEQKKLPVLTDVDDVARWSTLPRVQLHISTTGLALENGGSCTLQEDARSMHESAIQRLVLGDILTRILVCTKRCSPRTRKVHFNSVSKIFCTRVQTRHFNSQYIFEYGLHNLSELWKKIKLRNTTQIRTWTTKETLLQQPPSLPVEIFSCEFFWWA